jgi:predicted dehydrogenase
MTSFFVHTADEAPWRDAARRLHQARLVAAAGEAQAEVFDGALLAKPPAIRAALEAGLHVIVAAEPCLSRAELDSLQRTAKQRSLLFALFNPDRFLASRQLLRKQIDGPLGSLELLRSHRWENHVAPAPLGLSGSLVGEIEQAAWFYGRPVRSVFAMQPVGLNAAQVQLCFGPGMATIDYCDALQGTTLTGYRSLSLIGSRGSAQVDDHTNTQLAYVGGDGPTGVTVGEGVRHLAAMLDECALAIAANRDFSSNVSDALHSLDVVAAVQKSLATHEPVALAAAEAAR